MKFFKLLIGILFFAIGIVFTIQANLGIGPWDAFHQGISFHTNLTFGQAGIIVGLILLVINLFMKQYIGIGTLLNTVGVGLFIDLFMFNEWIAVPSNTFMSFFFLFLGMFIIALASYFYIGAGFGTGPRDGLMIGLHILLNKPVGLVRSGTELLTCFFGYLLGGQIGLGTLIIAFGIGPIIQLTFKLLKFDVKAVEHKYIKI